MSRQPDPNFAEQIAEWISEFGMAFLVGMLVIIAIGVVLSRFERPGKSKDHHRGDRGRDAG